MQVPLAKPEITREDIEGLNEVIRTDYLSIGPKVEAFEAAFRSYLGVRHAVAVNSGTSGLHLLVRAMGIGPGDEVITTPFSFVASTNCILFERATPVFVDIDPVTLNIDVERIAPKITRRTKALLPVGVFGHPLPLPRLMELAARHNLKVIEDSCEALGSEYEGVKAGTLADGAVFGFYPNKQITAGEGGMIVTDDAALADLCRSLRSQGRASNGSWLHHERIGYNYRLSELNAVLGLTQMKRIDAIIARREQVAKAYNERLQGIPGVTLPPAGREITRMSWFVYVVRLDTAIDRDRVMEYLRAAGVECKPYFTPIHLQPYMQRDYGFRAGDYPLAEAAGRSCLALPFFNTITETEIEYVREKLGEAIDAVAG